jgi:geranylgeranyl diphosphate synthase type II
MEATMRIEQALGAAIARAGGPTCPAGLANAVRYAVFPGGARIRPRLCLAVAQACAEDQPAVTDAAAAAIELLHCASLVHDDLPCFDNAPIRRGMPSVHRAFGEQLAVLTGDALIVLAFETVALAAAVTPARLAPLVLIVSRSVGMPAGIAAGQAWECESNVDLAQYHRAKTGSLFAAATMAGAKAAGAVGEPWRTLGERLGEAFQVADDIRDVAMTPEQLGKPVGQDEALGRQSAVKELGLDGAIRRLERLMADAVDSIPDCPGEVELRQLILLYGQRFLPEGLARAAA